MARTKKRSYKRTLDESTANNSEQLSTRQPLSRNQRKRASKKSSAQRNAKQSYRQQNALNKLPDPSPYDSNRVRWQRLAKFDFWIAGFPGYSPISAPTYRFKASGGTEAHVVCHATRVFIDDRDLLKKAYVPEGAVRQQKLNFNEGDEVDSPVGRSDAEQSLACRDDETLNFNQGDTEDDGLRDRRLVNPMLADEPIFAFEGEFADDAVLLRSLGLPLGFLNSPFDLDNRKRLTFPAMNFIPNARITKQPAVVYEAPMPGPWTPLNSKNMPVQQKSIFAATVDAPRKPNLQELYNLIVANDAGLSSSTDDDDEGSAMFTSHDEKPDVTNINLRMPKADGESDAYSRTNELAALLTGNSTSKVSNGSKTGEHVKLCQIVQDDTDEKTGDGEVRLTGYNNSAAATNEQPVLLDDPSSVWFVADDDSALPDSFSTGDTNFLSNLTSVVTDDIDDSSDDDDDDDDILNQLLFNPSELSMASIVMPDGAVSAGAIGLVDGGRVSFNTGKEKNMASLVESKPLVMFDSVEDADDVFMPSKSIAAPKISNDLPNSITHEVVLKTEIAQRATFRVLPSSVKAKVNEFLTLSDSNNDNYGGDITHAITENAIVPKRKRPVDLADPLDKMRYTVSSENASKRFRVNPDLSATTEEPVEDSRPITKNVRAKKLVTVVDDDCDTDDNTLTMADDVDEFSTVKADVDDKGALHEILFAPEADKTVSQSSNKLCAAAISSTSSKSSQYKSSFVRSAVKKEDDLDFPADARVHAAGVELKNHRALQVRLAHNGLGLPDRQGLVKLLHSFGYACSYQAEQLQSIAAASSVATQQPPAASPVARPRFGSKIMPSATTSANNGKNSIASAVAGIQKYRVTVQHDARSTSSKSRRTRQKYLDFGWPHWETQNDLFALGLGGGAGKIYPDGHVVDLDAPEEEEEHAQAGHASNPNYGSAYKDAQRLSASKKFGTDASMPTELLSNEGEKYWNQRYRLFSRFNNGIMIAPDSWCGVTPERIAKHIAVRCQCDVVVDAFGGAGSSAIQLAQTCGRVIYIEIDPVKVAYAKHNAGLYGVADRIEFINADFFTIAPHLTADAVFLSPPWGGPAYQEQRTIRLGELELDGVRVFEAARRISPNIAYFLPRNIDIEQLAELAACNSSKCNVADETEHDVCQLELEQQFLNTKLKTITAYFGALVDDETFLD